MDEVWLRVGEVASRTGLTVRTLHHYDELGLLVPSGRSSGDYRLYSTGDLRRLLSIQHLKSLGLSLEEVADALDDPAFDARAAVDRHIAAVQGRIAAERELLARLRGLRGASEIGWDEVLEVIALTERLRHPDAAVRVRAALDAPAGMPLPTLVATLVADPSDAVRETLTWAIARHGTDATAALLPHLNARDPRVRAQIAHVLSKLRDPASLAPLAALLDDPDATVAAKAAFALGQLGDPAGTGPLVQHLGHRSLAARDEISDALAALGPAASEALTAALGDDDASVREHAADALAGLADPATVDALGALLSDPEEAVRLAAAAALGQLRPASDAWLRRAAGSGPQRVAVLARRLLGPESGH